MTDQLPLGLPPGSEEQQPRRNPEPDGDWAGRDWFHLVILEWMWHEDGLALRPGAELMVYATVYRASAHGGGAYVATNASMGELLGYPRETVNRVVSRLIDAGLIWPVWRIQGSHGGRPVKCYAVCQPAIERALRRMTAHQLKSGLAAGEPADSDADDNRPTAKRSANVTEHHIEAEEGFQHCVTERHIENVDNPRHNVTERHIGPLQCDGASHSQCDETSHVTKRHIGENDISPADTSLFNTPHISTYHISTDQGGASDDENPEGDDETCTVSVPSASVNMAGHTLSPDEVAAFNALVSKSLRPVDAGYVEQNLREFAHLISEGVGADVILTAYDEYAGYQRQMLRERGENRPMHLLNWLRQKPNTNIQYVLNRLDGERPRRGDHLATRRGRKPPASHENPRLDRLVDDGTHVWHVTDERGGRLIEGSRGIDSPTQAMALYQAMYEREDPAHAGR